MERYSKRMVSRNEGNGYSQLPSSNAINSVSVSAGDAEVQSLSMSINLGCDCQNIRCSLKKEVSISFIVFSLIYYYDN